MIDNDSLTSADVTSLNDLLEQWDKRLDTLRKEVAAAAPGGATHRRLTTKAGVIRSMSHELRQAMKDIRLIKPYDNHPD